MTTISFGAFVFGSIGVLLSVVDLVDARKIIKVCLMLKLVFLVLFSDIDFFVFQKAVTVAYFMTTIFLSIFSFRINWRLLPFGFMDVWKILKVCLIFPILPICCISRFFLYFQKNGWFFKWISLAFLFFDSFILMLMVSSRIQKECFLSIISI